MSTANPHMTSASPAQRQGTNMTTTSAKKHITTTKPLSFSGVFKSEWIKAFSLRSIMWSIIVSIFLGAAMSGLMAITNNTYEEGAGADFSSYFTTLVGFPTVFLSLVFGVLGVFFFSNEYASGMILSTLTATPKRGLVVAAKSAVLIVVALIVALTVAIVAVALGIAFLPESAGSVFTTETLTGIGGSIFYLVAIALMSFGIAGILRSTAASITTVVGIVFLAPMIMQLAYQVAEWKWLEYVIIALPQNLGSLLGKGISAVIEETDGTVLLSFWGAVGIMALWTVIPMIASVILFKKRDAK